MLVNWKGTGVLVVKPVDVDMKDPATANLIPSTLFYPGWNDVPDEIWDKCAPHVDSYVTGGMVEIITKKSTNEAGESVYMGKPFAEIASKDPREALNLIQNCYNVAVLKQWEKETTRDELRVEAKNQIELCLNGGQKVE